jgi:hypothetical protein
MFRIRKLTPFLALLLGCLLFFGASGAASASYTLNIIVEDVSGVSNPSLGGTVTAQQSTSIVTSAVTNSFSASVGAYTVVGVSTLSNITLGGQSVGQLDTGLQVIATSTTTDILRVTVSVANYPFPAVPATLTSDSGSPTVLGGGATPTLNFISWIDLTNNAFGVPTGAATALNTSETGFTQFFVDASSNSKSTGFVTPATSPKTVSFSGGTQPYSITNMVELSGLTANSTYSTDSGTTVGAVPVPAGMVMALSGLGAIGGAWVLRRRFAKAAILTCS